MSGSIETDGGQPDAPGTGPEADTTPEPPAIDRAAALAEGAPGIPAQFIWWVLGVVLVVSLVGLLGEHLFSSSGGSENAGAVVPGLSVGGGGDSSAAVPGPEG